MTKINEITASSLVRNKHDRIIETQNAVTTISGLKVGLISLNAP